MSNKALHKEAIVENSYVDIHLAVNMAMLEYPHILARPEESSPTLASQATSFIMDSGIGNADMTNEDIFNRADYLNADIVVCKDTIDNPAATTSSVVDMCMLNEDKFKLIIPLQASDEMNRVDHYYTMKDELQTYGFDIQNHRIGIGGVKDDSIIDQITTTKYVVDGIDSDVETHAFGCGMNREWVAAIRKEPTLLTSLDSSTIVMQVNNGKTFNADMTTEKNTLPRGEKSTCLNAMQIETNIYKFNHLISDFIRDVDAIETFNSDTLTELFN